MQFLYILNNDSQIDAQRYFLFVILHMEFFLRLQNVTVFLSGHYFIISHTEKSIMTETNWKFIIEKITNIERMDEWYLGTSPSRPDAPRP